MKNRRIKQVAYFIFAVICSGLGACTTVVIDQTRKAKSVLNTDDAVVVIGRRSNSDYETEGDLISCVGKQISGGDDINVIPEEEFVDALYPWFEPRIAPTKIEELNRLLSYDELANAIEDYNVHYVIWIDGSTETTSSSGQINCGITGAGLSCFGFGTWDKKAEYEASIWDYRNKKLIGKVSSTADGTSYMPAVVVPIPIIAPVQGDACKAMGSQLKSFFTPKVGA